MSDERILEIEVELTSSEPRVWRRFLISNQASLEELHDVLQVVMGWEDDHTFSFMLTPKQRARLEDDSAELEDVPIGDVLLRKRSTLTYVYDYGDAWEHTLRVTASLQPDDVEPPLPRCVAGARSCPPEDMGGIHAYQALLEALDDPSSTAEGETLLEDHGDFDPDAFSVEEVNEALADLAEEDDDDDDDDLTETEREELMAVVELTDAFLAARGDGALDLCRRVASSIQFDDPECFATGTPQEWAAGIVWSLFAHSNFDSEVPPPSQREVRHAFNVTVPQLEHASQVVSKAMAEFLEDEDEETIQQVLQRMPEELADTLRAEGIDPADALRAAMEIRGLLPPPPEDGMWRLKVTLIDSDPPIWREVWVPGRRHLGDLHEVLQASMGWDGTHLHLFHLPDGSEAGSAEQGLTEDGAEDESELQVYEVLPLVGARLVYEYDLGDSWSHTVEALEILEAEEARARGIDRGELSFCMAGAGACPPEDCGGVSGYAELLELRARGARNDHEREALEWLGDHDPEAFSLPKINQDLAALCGMELVVASEEALDRVRTILRLLGDFCREHLDNSYWMDGEDLLARLLKEHPTRLQRGKAEAWAAGIAYTVARWGELGTTEARGFPLQEIGPMFGVGESTGATKSKLVCDLLRIDPERGWRLA